MSNVIFDLKNLNKRVLGIRNLTSKDGMERIGQEVKKYNLEQIENQKEADGSQVKPYSKRYRERKGESQVTYVGKKSTYSKKQRGGGHMMFAFGVVSVKDGEVTVGFRSKLAKQKAEWNARHRQFIGLTPKNANKLFRWINKIFFK